MDCQTPAITTESVLNTQSIQALFLASIALLAAIVIARPHLLIRPSFAFACMMSLVINPAAAFVMKPGYPDSPLFDSLRLSSVMFPLGVVAWCACTPFLSSVARSLRIKCQNTVFTKPETDRSDRILMWACFGICALIAARYFAAFPIQSTGLWAIMLSTGDATQAREDSLKLFDSAALKYAFSIGTTAFVPIGVSLVILRLRRLRIVSSAGTSLIALCLVAFAGITGARMPMGRVIISVVIAIALISHRRSKLLILPFGGALAIAMIASLTLMRSGKSVLEVGSGLVTGIANRAFVMPFETGLLSVQFASEQGFLDGANVRPYAILTAQPYLELPSEVYMKYFYGRGGAAIESGSANTSFLFDFQAGFGIWPGWWIALMAICALDFGLMAFRTLQGLALPAVVAAFLQITAFKLTSGAFTTALITGGIGLTLAIGFLFPKMVKPRYLAAAIERPTPDRAMNGKIADVT